jgi:MFS family permease
MAAGGAVLALASSVVTWSASILLVALGSSGISGAAAAVADRVPAPELGRELGLFRLVGDLGLVVGPIVTGFIYQASGPRLAGLATAAVFAAAAIAAAAWVTEARGPQRPEDTGEIVLE